MDTEEIKKEIVAKLQIEREVREQLERQQGDRNAPIKKSPWAWLESKFGLLVIGAIVSGILVPTFQYTQESIKWQRQNRYSSLEHQLGSMRESLKQFIAVQALSAELYDLGLAIMDAPSTTAAQLQLEQWRKDFRALQAQRIQQNAAFAATVFYFPIGAQQPIRQAWNDLMRPSQQLQTVVGDLLTENQRLARGKKLVGGKPAKSADVGGQLDVSLAEVNQAYEHLLSMLRQQLLEVEHESSEFR